MPSCIPNFKNDGRTEQRKLLLLDGGYDYCPVSALLVFYVFSHHALVGGDVRTWMGLRQHRRGSEGQEDHIWYCCWWHPTELYASGVAGIMGEQIPNRFEVYAKFCQMDYLGGKLTGGC